MGVENHSPAKRLMALMAAVCTLGSLAVTPMANAEDATPTADDVQCLAVDTKADESSFVFGKMDSGSVSVNGFVDGFNPDGRCIDLTISNNVTWVGESAFKNSNIHSVKFVNNAEMSIGDSAFADNTGLERVDMPAISGSGIMVGRSAFARLTSGTMSSLTIAWPKDGYKYAYIYNDAFKGSKNSEFIMPVTSRRLWLQNVVGDDSARIVIPDSPDSEIFFDEARPNNASCGMSIVLPEHVGGLVFRGNPLGPISCPADKPTTVILPRIIAQGSVINQPFKVTPGQSILNVALRAPINVDEDYWGQFMFTGDLANVPLQDADGNPVDLTSKRAVISERVVDEYGHVPNDFRVVSREIRNRYELTAPNNPLSNGSELTWNIALVGDDSGTYSAHAVDENGNSVSFDIAPGTKVYVTQPGIYEWAADWTKLVYSVRYDYSSLPYGVTAPTKTEDTYANSYDFPTIDEQTLPEGVTFDGWTWTNSDSQYAEYSNPDTPVKTLDEAYAKKVLPMGNLIDVTPHFTDSRLQPQSVAGVQVYPGESPKLPATVQVKNPADGSLSDAKVTWTTDKDASGVGIDWSKTGAGSVFTLSGTVEGTTIPASVKVTVVARPSSGGGSTIPSYPAGLEVTYKPNKLEYKIGEAFDTTGMVVKYQGHVLGSDQYTVAFDSSKPGKVKAYITLNSDPSKATTVEVTVVVSDVQVHRLYNRWSGEHFYTAGETEYKALVKAGWTDEGVGFTMADYGTPVYRLYLPGGKHLFTTSVKERDVLKANRWRYEGVAFYVRDDGAFKTEVHRLYNPWSGDHLLTTSSNERGVLVLHKWKYEGVAFQAK